jgi:hypothetical protein
MFSGSSTGREMTAGSKAEGPGLARALRAPLEGAREGAVLVLAIVLVVLMTLVAIGVATNTAGELSVSSNTDSGRRAFIQADSALRIRVGIARILLFPSSGDLDSYLNLGSDLEIEVEPEDFDLARLRQKLDESGYSYTNRYLVAGARSSGIAVGGDTVHPLITFKRKDPANPSGRVVATSAVSLDYGDTMLVGGSYSAGNYSEGSNGKRIVIIVSTDGRVPTGASYDDSEEGSLFDGSADTTHAILTTAFQEVVK